LKTSPSISKTPLPPVIVRPLFSPNPSYMHTSTEVEGAGVLPSTSSSLKSVGGGCAGGCWSLLRLGTSWKSRRLDSEAWKGGETVETAVLVAAIED
jgi:hypothetical protein